MGRYGHTDRFGVPGRKDVDEAFLPIAAQVPQHVAVEEFPLEQANEALLALRRGHVRGAKVLRISPSP